MRADGSRPQELPVIDRCYSPRHPHSITPGFSLFALAFGVRAGFVSNVRKRFLFNWLPLVFWMSMIFLASTDMGSSNHTSRFIEPLVRWLFPGISDAAMDMIHYCVRKTAHMTEYGILAILLWRVIRGEARFRGTTLRREFFRVILLAVFYASTDEFHQSFSDAREGRVSDVGIDACGATCGALAMAGFIALRKRKASDTGQPPG